MIKKVTITNYLGESVEYKIEGVDVLSNNGLLITEIEGLGPVKANLKFTELSTTDGRIANSKTLEGRDITIHAQFTWCNTIEEARLSSYKFFPIGTPVTFQIETDNRLAETVGYVETNEPEIFSDECGCEIGIACESPFFLATDGIKETLFSAVVPIFEFNYHLNPDEGYNGDEYENEGYEPVTEFGEIIHKRENTVYYEGDVETGCTIEISAIGEVRMVRIYNIMTRERMIIDTTKLETLTGSGFNRGDKLTICTIPGKKSMTLLRNGETTNVLNILGKHSDWFMLARGDNVFSYTADYGEENVYFKIVSQTTYEGV